VLLGLAIRQASRSPLSSEHFHSQASLELLEDIEVSHRESGFSNIPLTPSI
jgi:hypothetical protein